MQLSLFDPNPLEPEPERREDPNPLLGPEVRVLRGEYDAYIKSKAWYRKRYQALLNAKYRCQKCGKKKRPLQAHHKNYECLGRERRNDVEMLCMDHHPVADAQREYATAYASYLNTRYGDNSHYYYDDERSYEDFERWHEKKRNGY